LTQASIENQLEEGEVPPQDVPLLLQDTPPQENVVTTRLAVSQNVSQNVSQEDSNV
tara:strand:- start:4419 stop:4586 length:168 start_codon:yes stop_codon:yes gene_type:complete